MDIKENTKEPKPLTAPDACAAFLGFFALCVFLLGCVNIGSFLFANMIDVPETDITIASMNFTMFNTSEASLGADWDLSIRLPPNLPGLFICLNGDFQASLLYKDFTIITTRAKGYNNLQHGWPQFLTISGVVSGEDIEGAIGKSIQDDIKEASEVRFRPQLFFPDCRKNTIGMMKFVCDEAKLRYDSRSHELTPTLLGNPTCRYND